MNTHLHTFETPMEAQAAFKAALPENATVHAYRLAGLQFKTASFHESIPSDAQYYLLSRVRGS